MSLGSTAGGRITAGVGANLIGQHAHDRNQEATVYVGNLDPQVGCQEVVYDVLVIHSSLGGCCRASFGTHRPLVHVVLLLL